jgi:small GTP-binding protein
MPQFLLARGAEYGVAPFGAEATPVSTTSLLNQLFTNLFDVVLELDAVMIYDRDGLIIASYERVARKNIMERRGSDIQDSDIYGAISSTVEETLRRIQEEYKVGSFGTGTFFTDERTLIFMEAGPPGIILYIFKDIDVRDVLPYCFLVAEKVGRILEDRWEPFFPLTIPNLEMEGVMDLNPSLFSNFQMGGTVNEDGRQHVHQFKLIVVGDSGVGKTSLINQFVAKKFVMDYRPTLGISITSQTYYIQGFEEAKINFLIWDLAGQKFFNRVRKRYYSHAQSGFIIYDVTDRDTFSNVVHWYDDISVNLENIPLILIGNKIDLEDARKVSTEEGRALAQKLKCTFMETSAKTGANVQDAFSILGIGLFFRTKAQREEDSE